MPARDTSPSVKDPELYEEWTVSELRDRAADLDISGRSSMKKSELIKAIRSG